MAGVLGYTWALKENIPLENILIITGDYFFFDERNHALIGERTKKIYQLGDLVKVTVAKADLIKRHLDFTMVQEDQ